MIYTFDDHSLDSDRRELRRGDAVIPVEPQVFDLLQFLIDHRERVVAKHDLLDAIWKGRVVAESTLSSRIAALRRAVGERGEQQRLIRTVARKGFRFVGTVSVQPLPPPAVAAPATVAAMADPFGVDRARPEVHPRPPIMPERRQLTILACRIGGGVAGEAQPDPEELGNALIAHRATGANFQSSYNLSRLAEAHGRAGRHDRAIQLARNAIAEVRRSGELWWEAEAQRQYGEILLQAGPANHKAARRCFVKALTCAKRQNARLWEMNANRSLERL